MRRSGTRTTWTLQCALTVACAFIGVPGDKLDDPARIGATAHQISQKHKAFRAALAIVAEAHAQCLQVALVLDNSAIGNGHAPWFLTLWAIATCRASE